jgi:hypothetical protein
MKRYITHVRKDEKDNIIAVKTYEVILKTAQVVERINHQTDTFFVKDGIKEVPVGVYKERWIRTHADGYWNNNLDNLPRF